MQFRDFVLKDFQPGLWLKLTRDTFKTYGTNRIRSKEFDRSSKQRKVYDTVAAMDCLVIPCNGKTLVIMRRPKARITRTFALKRQVVLG